MLCITSCPSFAWTCRRWSRDIDLARVRALDHDADHARASVEDIRLLGIQVLTVSCRSRANLNLVPSQQIAAEMQFVGSPDLAKLCQWTYPAHHVGTVLVFPRVWVRRTHQDRAVRNGRRRPASRYAGADGTGSSHDISAIPAPATRCLRRPKRGQKRASGGDAAAGRREGKRRARGIVSLPTRLSAEHGFDEAVDGRRQGSPACCARKSAGSRSGPCARGRTGFHWGRPRAGCTWTLCAGGRGT
jgi:hypothetical protein